MDLFVFLSPTMDNQKRYSKKARPSKTKPTRGKKKSKLNIPDEMRKKNNQPTIDKFFQKGKERENWQGFPYSQCYPELDGRMYYRPRGYGEKFEVFYQSRELPVPSKCFCVDCGLRPCIMEEEQEVLHGTAKRMFQSGADYTDVWEHITNTTNDMLLKLFGKDYFDSAPMTFCCVSGTLNEWFPREARFTGSDDFCLYTVNDCDGPSGEDEIYRED